MGQATQHDRRHFIASALSRAGLNPQVVAERLGHPSAAMTLNVYAHLWADDKDRTRQAVAEALAPYGRCAQDVPKSRILMEGTVATEGF